MTDQDPPKPVVFPSSDEFLVERVFPIRNLVGDTEGALKQGTVPAPEGAPTTASGDDLADRTEALLLDDGAKTDIEITKPEEASPDAFLPPPYPPIPPEHAIRKLPPQPSKSDITGPSDYGFGRKTTERTQMVPSSSRSTPPGVLPGVISDPSRQKFYRCEDEPIHTPGAIQQ